MAVSGGEIVGQAMYVRSENEAEVAVVVEDAWQRRGIGTLLLAELAALAGRRGIGAFTGAVLPESSQMLGLASAARARRRYSAEDGAYLIHVPLESRVRCANLAVKHATRRGTEGVGDSANTPHEGGLNTSQTPHRCYTLSPLGTRALVGRLERHTPKGR